MDKKAINILKKHFQHYYAYYLNQNEKNWCKTKYKHSFLVAKMTRQILKKEISLTNFPYASEILTSAYLHDLGRFCQMENGSLKIEKHGLTGRKILEKSKSINDMKILLWVEHHDDPLPDEIKKDDKYNKLCPNLKKNILDGLHILRDADMLANMKMYIDDNNLYIPRDNYEPHINEEIMSAVLEKRAYKSIKYLITQFDSWASRFCWENTYHWTASKQINKEMETHKFLFNYVKKLQKISIEKGYNNQSNLKKQIEMIKNSLI